MAFVPFVSNETLSKIVDDYISGKAPLIDVDQLYPFLSKEDFKKLFKYHLNQK